LTLGIVGGEVKYWTFGDKGVWYMWFGY
jgi:hypothetical protein